MTPALIWTYYRRAVVALTSLRNDPAVRTQADGPFFGMLMGDFETALAEMRAELDTQVTLALVASFEAVIRLDFEDRCTRRLKDAVSKGLRKLRDAHGKQVGLEDILNIWTDKHGTPHVIKPITGNFKQLIRFRHWLAHGRYWDQTSGIDPTPEDALVIGEALFEALPAIRQPLV